MVRFAVDEVEAVVSEVKKPSRVDLEGLLGAKVVHASPALAECSVPIVPGLMGINGLVLTVHSAFAEHRPLTLSPDDFWMAIIQGFAIHVRQNAARLRERFVDFAEVRTLSVSVEGVEDWAANTELFRAALARAVNPGIIAALTDRFSTTTDDHAVAFTIAAMDTFSPFFDFELFGVCGIPSITLTGTPDDWRGLRARFRVLAEYDLQWWAAALEPVFEQLVATSEGRIDSEFWRSIYKPRNAYFQDQITGWLPRLFPYLDDGSRNEFSSQGWGHPPIQPRRLPRGLSAARVRVEGRRLITLNSGFFGARQLADGSLAPVIAWTVGESTLDQLFDALERRHRFEPPVTGSSWDGGTVPAELLAFSARFGGGRLYHGELTLLPLSSEARVGSHTTTQATASWCSLGSEFTSPRFAMVGASSSPANAWRESFTIGWSSWAPTFVVRSR